MTADDTLVQTVNFKHQSHTLFNDLISFNFLVGAISVNNCRKQQFKI